MKALDLKETRKCYASKTAQKEPISEKALLALYLNILTGQDSIKYFHATSSCRATATWLAGVTVQSGMENGKYIGKHLIFEKTCATYKVTWGDSPRVP